MCHLLGADHRFEYGVLCIYSLGNNDLQFTQIASSSSSHAACPGAIEQSDIIITVQEKHSSVILCKVFCNADFLANQNLIRGHRLRKTCIQGY